MLKNKLFQLGAIAVMGALLLGAAGIAVPAMADSDGTSVQSDKDMPHRGGPGGGLDQALENGKITQAEYDAMKALQEKMDELKDNYSDLSREERQTAMEEDRKEILDQMLSAGTITQELYDKLAAHPLGGPAGPGPDRRGGLDQALENGKITQAEYDAMKAVQENMAQLREDYSNLSGEERHTAMEKARTEILDKMLADGTITQELYDKLIAGPEQGTGFGGSKAGGRNQ